MFKDIMTRQTEHERRHYEPLETTIVFSGLSSRICAQSVVTETKFNKVETLPQESGGEVNFSDDKYNHSWEEVN